VTFLGIDLDKIARAFLQHSDYRVGGLVSLLICIVLACVRHFRSNTRPTIIEFLGGILGLLSAYSGFTVAIVFLATKPPAFQFLSGDGLTLAGITTLVGTAYLGWRQIVASFFPPQPPSSLPSIEQHP
jgi:hypothetical protein